MPDLHETGRNSAKHIIDLSPDRVPEFINQSKADRSLSQMMVALNRQFRDGAPREREMAKEALVRLGFVHADD